MGLHLSPAETTALEHRTEGWIAGLQMAAISMQGLQDTGDFVRAFTGSHRHILDYLLEEVLNRQPKQVQNFLLQTSILERLCGPLCEAIWDRGASPGLQGQVGGGENQISSAPVSEGASTPPGASLSRSSAFAQEILEYLEQANLFIMPLDDKRCWYRYHHLFADLLRHRLTQTELVGTPVDVAALHRRASEWYEQNRLLVEAMSHALAAVDVERVVRLAKQKAAAMLSRSELVTVLSWLDTLPDALDRSRPHLSLLRAWAMVLTDELQAVEAHLQEAEQELKTGQLDSSVAERTDILGEVATLRAAVAYFQRDMPAAITLFRQALEHLPVDNLFLRGIIMQCLGAAYSWCGNVVEAIRTFDEASVISQATGNMLVTLIAMWNLAQLYEEQGYLHQAADVYRQALALVDQQTEADKQSLLSFIGRLHIGLAELLYQWNDFETAMQRVLEGIKLGEQEQESSTLACGYLVLARLKQTQGDDDGLLAALQKARQFAQRYTGPRYLLTQVTIFQARLWLTQGNLRAVADWVQEQNLQLNPPPDSVSYLREDEYLVLVRLLMAQGQEQRDELALPVGSPLTTAIDLLARIIEAARAAKRTGRVIEALTLQALVFNAQGNTAEALAVLHEALVLAEPGGYIRLFVDEGSSLADLLRRAAAQNVAQKYVAKLLPLLHQSPSRQPLSRSQSLLLLDPLSERELEILQLIATGMSNKELAEELVVTVGTVKWHLNNIYSKLAVRSRTQAVARARELGLL
jgi:LuxR family maltose regulon positive regulatory protein